MTYNGHPRCTDTEEEVDGPKWENLYLQHSEKEKVMLYPLYIIWIRK